MKREEIAELAKRMKSFEDEFVFETKDVTLKLFWEPCPDGSGVYVVDYYKGDTVSEANITYGGEDWSKWGYDDTYKEETPKMFQNILYKLEKMLNQ